MEDKIDFSAFESVHRELTDTITRAIKGMQVFADSLPLVFIRLAEYGWYINRGNTTGDIITIQKHILEGRIDLVDNMLCDFVKKGLRYFERKIIANNPSRQYPIKAAFKAHRKKEYYLSIPVFLAQIDGISNELISVGFFKKLEDKNLKKSYYPATKNWVEGLGLSKYDGYMLTPLNVTGGWGKHKSEDNLMGITRHSILHGENSTYGTYVNSCKTLALLFYLDEVLRSHISNDQHGI